MSENHQRQCSSVVLSSIFNNKRTLLTKRLGLLKAGATPCSMSAALPRLYMADGEASSRLGLEQTSSQLENCAVSVERQLYLA
eukprot:4883334-Amphidinium_carterae.1